jgi:hypothetical protein
MTNPSTTLLTLLGLALAGLIPPHGYTPQVGERHAEFTLPDLQAGKPVSLADFRGKKVLLIQFASW